MLSLQSIQERRLLPDRRRQLRTCSSKFPVHNNLLATCKGSFPSVSLIFPFSVNWCYMLAHDNKLACLACSTTVTVSLNFGSKSWDVSPEDFNLGAIDRQGDQCMGGIFDLDSASNESSGGSGNSGPSWVIGDTFLVRITLGFNFVIPAR